MLRLVLATACILALAGPLLAQDASECTGLGFEDDPASTRAGVIGPEGRTHFVKNGSDEAGCPTDIDSCQRRAFLVTGDHVLVVREIEDYVCASFVNGQGTRTDGWLPADAIDRDRSSARWAGKWTSPSGDITITQDGDTLTAHGDASVGTGAATHVGSFDATGKPKKGVFAFGVGENGTLEPQDAGEFDCVVTLALRGPYLVAKDNTNCGGANVSFNGIYVKSSGN